jgi:hypothetical protein
MSLIQRLERPNRREAAIVVRQRFVHARGCVGGLVEEGVELRERVCTPALVGMAVVLHPLVEVRAQLAREALDEVDVLLLEGAALGPLSACVFEAQCQGAALLALEDVVLRVEDGDLVEEGEGLVPGGDELVAGHRKIQCVLYTSLIHPGPQMQYVIRFI